MDTEKTIIAILMLLILITAVNSFIIFSISSEKTATEQAITGQVVGNANAADIVPKGTPDYGAMAGVSFDNVESSLNKLAQYHNSIKLEGNDMQRYIKIATTKGTACEFCCGIGEGGFGTSNGQLACACEHNIAFSGLTKWLIKNTDYSDEQILQELQKWKTSFFPGPMTQKRQGSSGQLPSQVGGC